ncbi:MAG TPA: hypothetical protein PLG17_09195, partial [Thermodesulfobacteriota bacterium]|nr:hypothetical protein [Thermodesulfobacteriota bacterium]
GITLNNRPGGPGHGVHFITVDGMIISEGIQVVVEVADYVFKEGYPLMELDELAQFIDQHGHLPKIKSEAQVKKEGGTVSLGESYTLLLEKIEELTLYMIAQQKEIEELRKTVREMDHQMGQNPPRRK